MTSTPDMDRYPRLTWTGSHYGIVWWDDPAEVVFARVDSSGTKIGDNVQVTGDPNNTSQEPTITWTGAEYGLASTDFRDIFFFGSERQFIDLWSIEDILPKIWTGVSETTMFRAAMLRFLGDEVQSPRRNETFLHRYFSWLPCDDKRCSNLLTPSGLTDDIRQRFIEFAETGAFGPADLNLIIRKSNDYIAGDSSSLDLSAVLDRGMSEADIRAYVASCDVARRTRLGE